MHSWQNGPNVAAIDCFTLQGRLFEMRGSVDSARAKRPFIYMIPILLPIVLNGSPASSQNSE